MPDLEFDVVVLAGDIHSPAKRAVQWAADRFRGKPVTSAQHPGRALSMKLLTVELTHESETDFASWSTSGEIPPAEAIDRLMRVLAETRRTMEPAFPATLPVLIKDPPQVNGAAWQWSIQPDGSLVLNIRHPGLGWLGFRMPDVDRFHENLANVIDQRNTLRAELDPPV